MPQAPLVQAGRDHDEDPCQEAEDQGQKLQVGGAGQVHGEDWGWGWGWELGAGGCVLLLLLLLLSEATDGCRPEHGSRRGGQRAKSASISPAAGKKEKNVHT